MSIAIVEVEVYRVPPNERLVCVFERADTERRGVLALPLRLRGRNRHRGARLWVERIEPGVYGILLDPPTLPLPPAAPTPPPAPVAALAPTPTVPTRRGRRHAR